MDPKTRSNSAKAGAAKPGSVRKRGKGLAETARLFLDIDEVIRRSQTVPLTRYVE
jgi:hypothetical protein